MLEVNDEHGTVMVEYALVLGLLSIAFVAGLTAIEFATFTALTNLQQGLQLYGQRAGNSS